MTCFSIFSQLNSHMIIRFLLKEAVPPGVVNQIFQSDHSHHDEISEIELVITFEGILQSSSY